MLRKASALLLAALLLASCATLNRQRTVSVYFTSFDKYPDMWISPNTCTMPHKVLGNLTIEITPAIQPPQRSQDGVYSSNINTPQYERIGYDELLEMAVVEARARGANGISNIAVTTDKSDSTVYRYYVSGLLLKIE